MAAIIPPVTRLSSRIIRVLGCNPSQMTLQGTNTYIVGTGKDRILIDTGDSGVEKYVQHLKAVMNEHKITFKHIILTHWHQDHVGGVEEVISIDNNKDCRVWKYPRSDVVEDENSNKILLNRLEDQQSISVDGASLQVHHTPGHTTDHVVLTLQEENAVFSGDCILGEGTAVFEDLYNYMKSLHAILGMKPKVIYPGHGNVVEDPIPKIEYYIQHRNQREAQILEAFKQNPDKRLNAMDIVKIVYSDTPENLWPAASYNVTHHLDKLSKENKIRDVVVDGEHTWCYRKDSML